MITKELAREKVKACNSSYTFVHGIRGCANDLEKILEENETILAICSAGVSSRYMRTYITVTDSRIIYIKSGKRDLSLIPGMKNQLILYRQGLQFNVVKATGLAAVKNPYILNLNSNGMNYTFPLGEDITPYLASGPNGMNSAVQPERAPEPEVKSGQNNVNMRFCAHCGKPVEETWTFCSACGYPKK